MSRISKLSNVALMISAAITLNACSDSEVTDSGPVTPIDTQIASDFCGVAENPTTSYSASLVGLVEGGDSGDYRFHVESQPERGSISLVSTTGVYTYTPAPEDVNARGFMTSFQYAVRKDNVEQDTGEITLIYGAKRIMPLGDSITFGVTRNTNGMTSGDTPTAPDAVGYRKPLYDLLVNDGYAIDFVGTAIQAGSNAGLADTNHQGLPGWTSEQMQLQLDTWLTTTTPDIVLMHAGTNDIGFQSQTPAAAAADAFSIVTTIDSWHTSNSQPVTVFPAKIIRPNNSSFFNSTVANTQSFNTELESLVNASYGSSSASTLNVSMVDQYNALNVITATASTDINSVATGDLVGLHPSEGGYTKMANTWYQALLQSGGLVKCE